MFRMGWEIQIPISLSLPKKKKKKGREEISYESGKKKRNKYKIENFKKERWEESIFLPSPWGTGARTR